MSFVSGLLGTAGGVNGTGIAGSSGVNQGQLDTAYNQTQSGIQQQQNFVNALGAQNGLQNQSNVYGQLQNVASGQGPNPAQTMLNQATGANTANQAALMAGQRGSGQNVGLIARQAAQQGAANQQAAAGAGATMQANQSLGALGQLQGLSGTQVAQQAQGLQNLNSNSLQQQSNLLGLQGNMNTANASEANTSMTGQQGLLGGLVNGLKFGAEGGQVPKPMANGGGAYTPIDPNDPAIQQMGQPAVPQAVPQGAPVPAATSAPQAVPQQTKGPQSKFAQHVLGGTPGGTDEQRKNPAFSTGNTLGSAIMKGVNSFFNSTPAPTANPYQGSGFDPQQIDQERMRQTAAQQGGVPQEDSSDLNTATPAVNDQEDKSGQQVSLPADNSDQDALMGAEGGKVPVLLSPGEKKLDKKALSKVAKGANPMAVGETVPGNAPVKGAKNSYANDIVKDKMDAGDIVIPRSITQGKNPHWESMKFVSATIKKNRHSK